MSDELALNVSVKSVLRFLLPGDRQLDIEVAHARNGHVLLNFHASNFLLEEVCPQLRGCDGNGWKGFENEGDERQRKEEKMTTATSPRLITPSTTPDKRNRA